MDSSWAAELSIRIDPPLVPPRRGVLAAAELLTAAAAAATNALSWDWLTKLFSLMS